MLFRSLYTNGIKITTISSNKEINPIFVPKNTGNTLLPRDIVENVIVPRLQLLNKFNNPSSIWDNLVTQAQSALGLDSAPVLTPDELSERDTLSALANYNYEAYTDTDFRFSASNAYMREIVSRNPMPQAALRPTGGPRPPFGGPRSPQSALGLERTYPDPDPREYEGDRKSVV